jgi:hypothetical protein
VAPKGNEAAFTPQTPSFGEAARSAGQVGLTPAPVPLHVQIALPPGVGNVGRVGLTVPEEQKAPTNSVAVER